MAIQLTEQAAEHVSRMLSKRGSGEGLRIDTKKSGCTGFAYIVDYADEINDDDLVFESYGVKIVVDKKKLAQLDGMLVDFARANVINQGFEFQNPNVKNSCGCGESFSV